MTRKPAHNRILSIFPTRRGFGYAVMEGADQLIDWGNVEVRTDKHSRSLTRLAKLIDRYHPDHVVADHPTQNPHRGTRVQNLLVAMRSLVNNAGSNFEEITPSEVRRAFHLSKPVTKYMIAQGIAERFPELGRRLPPPRKPWMSEDVRMAMFDAIALAITYLARR